MNVSTDVTFNRSGDERFDTYGNRWAPYAACVRTPPCTCRVPCAQYLCPGCLERRPWCSGGYPDERCDACVMGLSD